MIGDRVVPKPYHTRAAEQIVELLGDSPPADRLVITVAGESGSGKSEIAVELQRLYKELGRSMYIFGQDDYFLYPPKTNDSMRRKDISHVGTGEVNLKLLDKHLAEFKRPGSSTLEKPLVIFDEDKVSQETIDVTQFDMGVAEGTYTSLLKNADYRVFINRSYEDTREDRIARKRDHIDDFSDKVLTIEHKIISKHSSLADIVVNTDYSATLTRQGKGRI
jgi:uridine kinase